LALAAPGARLAEGVPSLHDSAPIRGRRLVSIRLRCLGELPFSNLGELVIRVHSQWTLRPGHSFRSRRPQP